MPKFTQEYIDVMVKTAGWKEVENYISGAMKYYINEILTTDPAETTLIAKLQGKYSALSTLLRLVNTAKSKEE